MAGSDRKQKTPPKRGSKLVGERGFEPPTHWSQTSCATKLRYTPKTGCVRKMAGAVGFEPTARGFGDHCSTN